MNIKEKIKNTLSIIIMAIMIVFCINVVVQAGTFSTGESEDESVNGKNVDEDILYIQWSDVALNSSNPKNNVFCVEHNQALQGYDARYILKEIITINGNKATATSTEKDVTMNINGRLAYAIHYANNRTDRQKLIWYLMDIWKRKVQDSLGNGVKNFGITKGNLKLSELSENAENVLTESTAYAVGINNGSGDNATLKQLSTSYELKVRETTADGKFSMNRMSCYRSYKIRIHT